MALRRRRRVIENLPTPAQRRERRLFIAKGITGTVLLVAGTGSWLVSRAARRPVDPGGPLNVFTPEEAGVLLAVADRLVPEREGFPRPRDLQLAVKMDAIAAMADPITQRELRQLVRLFDSALSGVLLDGRGAIFGESSPERQDARLAAWAHSRVALRRTGYRALKRLCFAAYYASPETWEAVGYPGPPIVTPGEPVRRREPLRRPEPPRPEAQPAADGTARPPADAGPDGAPGAPTDATSPPASSSGAPSGTAAPPDASASAPAATEPAPSQVTAPQAAPPPSDGPPPPAPTSEAPPPQAPPGARPPRAAAPAPRPPTRRPAVLKPFTDRPVERDPLLAPKGGGDE